MNKVAVGLCVAGLAVAGCQDIDTYTPLIDPSVLPPERDMGADLDECRHFARQIDVQGQKILHITAGGALGGLLGALAGGIIGVPTWGGGLGAAYGASVSYASAQAAHINYQQRVIALCMRGRGYSVISP